MKNFILKLNTIQNNRAIWLVIAIFLIFLVAVAHFFMQNYLFMPPCLECVYIRFFMLVTAFGAILGAILPRNFIFKILGFLLAFYGLFNAISHAFTLNSIHAAAHSGNPFGVKGCSLIPIFPLNLPFNEWLPEILTPTGQCGFDNPLVPPSAVLSPFQQYLIEIYQNGWYLVPGFEFINMAKACLIAIIPLFILLLAMFFGFIAGLKLKARR